MGYRIKGTGNEVDVEIEGLQGKQCELVEAFEACSQGCENCPAAGGAGNLTSFSIDEGADGITLHLRSKEGTRLDRSEIAQCVEFAMKRSQGL